MANKASPLLGSAHEFLEESLKNFAAGKLSFAIVHAVTATELVLKERLARLNPALVFRDIDTKAPGKEQTVSLAALPRRLANLGMPLDAVHARLIGDIVQWRHDIVHHMPTYDAQAVQKRLPKLLDFLAGFLRTELATPLETFLSKDLYQSANRLLTDWQKAVAAAQSYATSEGNVLSDNCPRCGASGVMCLREENTVDCHLCAAALYRCECDSCGRATVTSYRPWEGENFCDDCVEAAGSNYIQMKIDIARGK
jgi:hypothetical protein